MPLRLIQVGLVNDELKAIEKRAKALGVASFKSVDVTEDYYQSCIRFLIFGNVLKNATYPLSVSAERMVQAIAVAKYVEETGAGLCCAWKYRCRK